MQEKVLNFGTVKLWSRPKGRIIHTFKGHEEDVTSVAISKDRAFIVSGSKDKTVKIWDRKKEILLKTLKGHKEQVNTLAISDDGAYIASGSGNIDEDAGKSIKLWNSKTGELIETFKESGNHPILSLAITKHGKYIVSTSGESIKLWSSDHPTEPIKEFVAGADGNWVIFDNISKKLYSQNNGKMLLKKEGINIVR
jgi:WD40 repeat protein